MLIKGRVQGVGFRYSVRSKAQALGLKGTVKNLQTGDVEIYCTGKIEQIKIFLDFLKNNPGWSKVEDIQKQEITDKTLKESIDGYDAFNIIL